jgi:hypothetical protein
MRPQPKVSVTMPQPTTAGRLLAELHRAAPALRDVVASSAAVSIERVEAAMNGTLRLSLAEQLRLAEAITIVAPRFTRQALKLRGQTLAAQSFERGGLVERHRDNPNDLWEHSSHLRR